MFIGITDVSLSFLKSGIRANEITRNYELTASQLDIPDYRADSAESLSR